jgi:hypothetical protein
MRSGIVRGAKVASEPEALTAWFKRPGFEQPFYSLAK